MEPPMMSHTGRYARSGAIAGAVSAFVFVVIHDIVISDIWFSLVFMLVAGAACGSCMGWAYGSMVRTRSLRSWAAFNAVFVALLFALGLASLLVFEPRTTLAAVIAENEPPGDLIAAALPMTLVFTAVAAMTISFTIGRGVRSLGPALVTSVLLVGLLGLNVSTLGLIDIPTDSVYLVAEFFSLIIVLDGVFAATFVLLERRSAVVPQI